MSVELPFLLPHLKNVLANPQGKNYPLVETRSLRLVMWYISGKVYRWKKFQAMLPNLSQIQGQKTSNYKLAWGQWTKRQVNPFVKDLWITFLVSCLKNLIKDYYSVEPWILLDLIFQHIMSTDDKSVGKHPKVCACIFNQGLSQPRYLFIWDVEILLLNMRTH